LPTATNDLFPKVEFWFFLLLRLAETEQRHLGSPLLRQLGFNHLSAGDLRSETFFARNPVISTSLLRNRTVAITMASTQTPPLKIDRYVVIHVATTCDEHGVYVTKDSAELIELGWILLDAHNLEEVSRL
jgi:hypothetical protein